MAAPGGLATVLGSLLRHAGWLLTLAGLILPGMQLYDWATCSPATATVTAVETQCKVRACKSCSWLPVRCDSPGLPVEAGLVERSSRVRLSFETRYGVRTASASFGKLNLSRASAGDQLPILYRRSSPRYVTAPFSLRDATMGLAITAGGLVLLMLARWLAGAGRLPRKPSVTAAARTRGRRAAAAVVPTDAASGRARDVGLGREALRTSPYAAGTPCVVQRARGLW